MSNDAAGVLETPWGTAQAVIELAPGIFRITTAEHGGYRLSTERRAEMQERMGFDHEWYEEDDEGRVVEAVFAIDLGIDIPDELLESVYPEVMEGLRGQSPVSFQEFLIEKDAFLKKKFTIVVPETERKAFAMLAKLTPGHNSLHGLKWLIQEAMVHAKFIRLEEFAGFAIFQFLDRSILVSLQSGDLYALPTADPHNVKKLVEWLAEKGIVQNP